MFKFMNSVLSEAPSRGLFCDCEIFANLRLKLYKPPSAECRGRVSPVQWASLVSADICHL